MNGQAVGSTGEDSRSEPEESAEPEGPVDASGNTGRDHSWLVSIWGERAQEPGNFVSWPAAVTGKAAAAACRNSESYQTWQLLSVLAGTFCRPMRNGQLPGSPFIIHHSLF